MTDSSPVSSQDSNTTHAFDKALQFEGTPDALIGKVSADYQNMVGPFGGITAAKIMHSVVTHPEAQGSPVSITVNFLGPIQDTDVEIYPRLTRTNRSNQHWSVEVRQGDEIQCTALLVFAHRKATWESEEIPFPQCPAPETIEPAYSEMTPAWVKQYDMRFAYGNILDPEVTEVPSESLYWIADTPARKLDFQALTAICDAFFPRLFIRTKKLSPAGTVTFSVYFHVNAEELQDLESPRVLAHARATKFSGNYHDQRGEIWGANKVLLATTTQLVYYKD